MSVPAHEILEAGRVQAGMSFEALWMAYFGLGGGQLPPSLRAYLAGLPSGPVEYDVVAHALNEHFVDRGGNHPVPYRSDIE